MFLFPFSLFIPGFKIVSFFSIFLVYLFFSIIGYFYSFMCYYIRQLIIQFFFIFSLFISGFKIVSCSSIFLDLSLYLFFLLLLPTFIHSCVIIYIKYSPMFFITLSSFTSEIKIIFISLLLYPSVVPLRSWI